MEPDMVRNSNPASNEYFKLVLDSMNDSIAIINVRDFRIVQVNSVFLEQLDLKEEDVIGKTCYEVTHMRSEPCAAPNDICPLFETVATGEHAVAEHVHFCNDGRKTYVEVSTSPVKDKEGKVIQVVHVSRDITERILAEQALRDQKEFARNLVQLSAVATFVIDSQHRIIYWNKACEELTGVKASEMVGTDNHWKPFYSHKRPCLADIIVDREFGIVSNYYDTYRQSTLVSSGLHAEGWYSNLGGKERYITFEAAPIYDSRGELEGAIETLQDITQRQKIEKERDCLIAELKEAFAKVKQLSGFLPICASCKKIRDDKGYWMQIEAYISEHSEAEFSHGICPECAKRFYPDFCEK